MRSLDEFATAKLGELEVSSLRRTLVDTTRVTGIWLLRDGRRLLSFSCNDYLNLTHHPVVQAAAIEALRAMDDGGFRHLPVAENGRILGVVSRSDFTGVEVDRLDEEEHLKEVIW